MKKSEKVHGPTSLRQWLPLLLAGRPHQVIGGSNNPYLLRWYVIPRNPLLNIYIHKFLRSDDDRALHDHPWWFVSLLLKGRYVEHHSKPTPRGVAYTVRHAGSIAFRPATTRHRVSLIHGFNADTTYGPQPVWTLIVTGRRVRPWGFWCKQFRGHDGMATSRHTDEQGNKLAYAGERFIPWQEWGDAGCGEE